METPDNNAPETLDTEARKLRIRTLNDTFRTTLLGGTVVVTVGIQQLDLFTKQAVLNAVQTFKDFTPDNDPYGEHDFGSIEVKDVKVFWKIDAYDENMLYGSEDPTDPAKTRRVLTIMLAEEY